MKRYFKKFYNDTPMTELSEAAALERGTYIVEDDLALRRYRRFIDRALDTIIYKDWEEAHIPLEDFRALKLGVEGQIFSPHPSPGFPMVGASSALGT